MKKIYLHIGEPKAGSTAIQDSLQKLFDHGTLKKYNFDLCWKDLLIFTANGNIKKSNLASYNLLQSELQKTLDNTDCDNIIFSCEAFTTDQEWLLETLKKTFVNYSVKIICYIRRQDYAMESQWAQSQKFLRSPPNYPDSPSVSKKAILDAYAQAFGKENLTIRVYSRKTLYNNDSAADFLEWLGLKNLIPKLENTQKNDSLSPTDLRIRLSYMRQNTLTEEKKQLTIKQIQEEINKNKNSGKLYIPLAIAKNGVNADLNFCNTLNKILKLEKTPKKNNHAYMPLEIRKNILEKYTEENASIAREYLEKEDGKLFDESFPKKTVSIDSPSTDDLVTSFIPIFVNLTQRIEKQENEIANILFELNQKNNILRETNQKTSTTNTNERLNIKNCTPTKNTKSPITVSLLQTFKNIIFQPIIKKNAFTHCNLGNLELAENIAQNVIANNPTTAWAYYILGKVQWQRGEKVQAHLTLQKAIDLEPQTQYFRIFKESCK